MFGFFLCLAVVRSEKLLHTPHFDIGQNCNKAIHSLHILTLWIILKIIIRHQMYTLFFFLSFCFCLLFFFLSNDCDLCVFISYFQTTFFTFCPSTQQKLCLLNQNASKSWELGFNEAETPPKITFTHFKLFFFFNIAFNQHQGMTNGTCFCQISAVFSDQFSAWYGLERLSPVLCPLLIQQNRYYLIQS